MCDHKPMKNILPANSCDDFVVREARKLECPIINMKLCDLSFPESLDHHRPEELENTMPTRHALRYCNQRIRGYPACQP